MEPLDKRQRGGMIPLVRLTRSQRRSIKKYRRYIAAQVVFLPPLPVHYFDLTDTVNQAAARGWLAGKRPNHRPDDDCGCVVADPNRPREGEGARRAEGEGGVGHETVASSLPGYVQGKARGLHLPAVDFDAFYPI